MSYIKWIFGIPQNLNFSFENDTNNDGLADGWTGDETQCEIYNDNDCLHGQRISYTNITSNEFYSQGGGTRICFRYKWLQGAGTPPNFSIGLIGWSPGWSQTITPSNHDWNFVEYSFSMSFLGDIRFIINCTNMDIIIEDLIFIHNNNLIDFAINPTFFDDTEGEREDKIHTINDEIFLVKPILYRYNASNIEANFDYIDRDQLLFLKTLMRQKVILRMSDDRLIACRIASINKQYRDGEMGACQHYSVKISLEEI